MEKYRLYLEEIRKKFPSLVNSRTKCAVDEGQFNDILILDDALVFRFPKYADSIATMHTEIEIFQRILRHYPATDLMLERADFYRGTYALQEALHGWKNDDQAALESGIEAYR